jgi:hypothetical protein
MHWLYNPMFSRYRLNLVLIAMLLVTATRLAQAQPAPEVHNISPAPDSTVVQLTFINVIFSDAVLGVNASDLRINGAPTVRVATNNPNDYTFYFPSPAAGTINVSWFASHGITDINGTPFAGGSWSYTLDPNSTPPPQVVISEFLADNGNGIQDEDGTRADWIELFNRGSVEANLSGWFLSDDRLNLGKWKFPAGTPPLAANSYLRIWASNKNRTNPLAPLHVNFRLAKEAGNFLALSDAGTNILSSFNPYPQQETDISYGRDRVDPELLGYFTTPTPGAQNTVGGTGFAADPVFSQESGVYTNASITLTISGPAGASIRYTRDGTVPTSTSTLYTNAITFTNNSTFKARVFQSGVFPSRVVARNFIFLDGTSANFNSKVPLMIISTDGRAIAENLPPGQARTKAAFVIIDTFRGQSTLRGTPDFHGFGEIEAAGQTSLGFPKKPYRFEIQDELLNDKNVSLLGMPADSDWRLRNPWNDKTLLNDFMAYELFEKMGHYSLRRRYVEVFVDSDGGRLRYPQDYIGLEVLLEHTKINNDRVDIAELTPFATNEPAITGGYIFKKDKDSTGDLNFATRGATNGTGFPGEALKLHEPRPNLMRTTPGVTTSWPGAGYTPSGSNQMAYLVNYLNRMESALYATNWLSLTGTNHYSNYLDVDSFVDMHWIVEFTKQIDGYRLSQFFHKDRNGKVKNGPIWDWNLAWGNANYLNGGQTNGWYFAIQSQGMTANEHIWLRRLINGNAAMGAGDTLGPGGDPDFNQKIADRWSVLRTNICGLSNTLARIDELSTLLSEIHARDIFGKYRPQLYNLYTWPNPDGTGNGRDVNFVNPTNYLGNDARSLIWQMKKWVTGRYTWIDSQFTPIPTFNTSEAMVTNGFRVTITGPPGAAIYYTVDGTDPRGAQGVTNGVRYTGPITISGNSRVVARARGASGFFNTWSGPAAVTLYTHIPPLRITEIMYHPLPAPPGSTNTDEDFEYVEVKNTGGTVLNVNRFSLGGGIQFQFPNVDLQPGELAVVVKNIAAFQSRYGTTNRILGVYTGSLNNAGDQIVLLGGAGESILDFSYDDEWYPLTDGLGFALTIVNENAARESWGLASSWRVGSAINGSPGLDDPAAPARPGVWITEALTHTDPPAVDVIEIHNPTGSAVDITGWFLTDDFQRPTKFVIPATTIPAGGYVTFDEADFNTGGQNSFALSSLGDALWLFSGNGVNLTGYAHGHEFGAAATGVTFGRYVTSVGEEHFVAQTASTLGASEAGPLIGPIVVSEINYLPWAVTGGTNSYNNTEDEFIELQNTSSSAVPLYDTNYPTNTWRLRDAVDFEFPSGATMPAQSYVIVASVDPNNAAELAAFRARNDVPASVPVFGPFRGRLDNEGDSVELLRPDAPEPPISSNPGVVPYILVERVRYAGAAPWPTNEPGIAFSLQRVNAFAYGNDPINWTTAGISPGETYSGGTAPAITLHPTNTAVVAYYGQASFSVAGTGTAPLRYQWRFGDLNINGANDATLVLSNVQPWQAGNYNAIIYNQAGYAISSNATLTVHIPAAISMQPTNLVYRNGSTNMATYGQTTNTAVFILQASSSTPMGFQWRSNGVPIQNVYGQIHGATSNILTISNVSLAHNGTYQCFVTDSVSAVQSDVATLTVGVPPFVMHPEFYGRHVQPVVALVGETATFSVVHGGTPPFAYRWQSNSVGVITNIGANVFATQGGIPIFHASFTVPNVQTSALARTYRVVITNLSNPSPGVLSPTGVGVPLATLTVLSDSDGDKAPDAWETQNGFNPADGLDGGMDADGDGMSNADEFRAGTDPNNPNSYLKVDQLTVAGTTAISFQAVSNKSYTVEFRDSLDAGLWSRLTDVSATTTNRAVTVLDTNAVGKRYYRLATPLQQD